MLSTFGGGFQFSDFTKFTHLPDLCAKYLTPRSMVQVAIVLCYTKIYVGQIGTRPLWDGSVTPTRGVWLISVFRPREI